MKKLIPIVAFTLLLGACSNPQKTVSSDRTKIVLDSVNAANAVNTANIERQKSIDSMQQMAEAEKENAQHHHMAYVGHPHNNHVAVSNPAVGSNATINSPAVATSSTTTEVVTTTTTPEKKK